MLVDGPTRPIMEPGMSAVPAETLPFRGFGDDQIITLAKLVIENAFQPIVETTTAQSSVMSR